MKQNPLHINYGTSDQFVDDVYAPETNNCGVANLGNSPAITYMDVGKGREQERKLSLRFAPCICLFWPWMALFRESTWMCEAIQAHSRAPGIDQRFHIVSLC